MFLETYKQLLKKMTKKNDYLASRRFTVFSILIRLSNDRSVVHFALSLKKYFQNILKPATFGHKRFVSNNKSEVARLSLPKHDPGTVNVRTCLPNQSSAKARQECASLFPSETGRVVVIDWTIRPKITTPTLGSALGGLVSEERHFTAKNPLRRK